MKNLIFILILTISSCSNGDQKWKQIGEIDIPEIAPIGLTIIDSSIWISDGDNNRIVEINGKGEIQQILPDYDRPMHLNKKGKALYIPEYGSDNIIKVENGQQTILSIPDSLDSPAGIHVFNDEIAIADFYNHRILYYNGHQWLSIGTEGKKKGELYYPTDVSIEKDKIFVADAYNNRIQVFDK